jgi:hypothetical protein
MAHLFAFEGSGGGKAVVTTQIDTNFKQQEAHVNTCICDILPKTFCRVDNKGGKTRRQALALWA